MKTIGDIINLIERNLESKNEILANHANTLLGPRTRGSTTEYGLNKLPKEREVEAVLDHSAVVDGECYKVYAPELKGQRGAYSLSEAWKLGYAVSYREGEHGPELFVNGNSLMLMKPELDVYIIIGMFEGEQAVFTWHPGEPLGSLQHGVDWTTAVKLHAG